MSEVETWCSIIQHQVENSRVKNGWPLEFSKTKKGSISKIIFYFTWISRYVFCSIAEISQKLFGYNYLMMPLCASLLMVQGTFSLLPLVVIEYFQLIYLIKSNADWRHPKSKFWLFFIKYLLILTEVMVKYYQCDSDAYVDLSTVLWIIDALVYKSFKHHKVYIDLTKVSLLLPGLVFWIKNYKFAALPTDPTFIPALLTILACFSENMQHEFNIPRKKFTFWNFDLLSENQNRFGVILNSKRLGILLSCAAFTGLYCTINVHRVLFVIPIVIWILNQRKVLNFTKIESRLFNGWQKWAPKKANP